MQRLNVQFVVQAGLGMILVIFFLLGIAGMYQIRATNQSMSNVVHVNQMKVELAHEMRDAIRLREIGLNKMLSRDDPFERDELLIQFYENAGIYRVARAKLLELPVDETEKEIHTALDSVISIAQPLNRKAAELITDESPRSEIMEAVKAASTEQQKLLGLLNQLVEIQHDRAHEAISNGTSKYDQSFYFVFILGVFAVVGALYIVMKVSKYVAGKNLQLAEASEAALSANKTKSAFLATMSHEIRTPLTAIIGFAETSLDSNQTLHDRINATKTIIRNGKHLLQIINDILDLSKIEANKLELEEIELSPFELLSDVESIVKPLAETKGIAFVIQYDFPIPKIIISDPLRLKQILINLLSNAIKFTETGHVLIQVKFNEGTRKLSFNVIDSGIGMTDTQIASIFDAFTQADSSTSRKYGGTGLGLSLSKELAQQLGGDITVKSLINTGSQFELTVDTANITNLEYVRDAKEIPSPGKYIENDVISDKFSGRILLAEDNPDNQLLLSHIIKNLGVSVDIADNGKIAISMANETHYDLILMDMQMPILNGMEAVKRLRKCGYTKPIVALTANAMKKDREECMDAGCDDFLTKPVDRKELHRVAINYLRKDSNIASVEPRIISKVIQNDPYLADLVDKFLGNLPNTYTDICRFNRDKNWLKLKFIVHQLKGTGGGMGFDILTEMAGKIEFQIVNEDYQAVDMLIVELGNIIDRIVPTPTISNVSISKVSAANLAK